MLQVAASIYISINFSTLPPQIQTLPPACPRKERGKARVSSDVEHVSWWKDWCIQSSLQIQEISHCVFETKQHHIMNILLQFKVSPQVSVQCLPSSKRIQKNSIWSLFTRTRNFRTIKAEGWRRRSFDKGRHVLFFFYCFCYDLKIGPVRVTHCACSDTRFTPGQQSIGILVTLQTHNLH